jgi:hypothetical protein
MQVGSLVRGMHTGEMWVVTELIGDGYVVINNRWTVPIDHLEVLNG